MQYEEIFDGGIVLPSHPPIIGAANLKASTKILESGTILKNTSGVFEPAAPGDTPCAVLIEQIEAHTETTIGLIVRHGLVVKSRLLDHSATAAAAPSEAMVEKLSGKGIYPDAGLWNFSKLG